MKTSRYETRKPTSGGNPLLQGGRLAAWIAVMAVLLVVLGIGFWWLTNAK